ncbi:MAG: hypothetical protein AB8B96_20280 [Lysobacterales bacterium]
MTARNQQTLGFLKTTLALLSSALVANCAAPRATLNSDLIQSKFGSYGVQVLEQTSTVRVSNLYSGNATAQTTRTFAVVQFNEPMPQPLLTPHQQVLAGGSLGSTLASNGWKLAKQTIQHTRTLATPRLARMMQVAVDTELATHVYALSAKADGVNFHYALIAEIHHPAHLSQAELVKIFPAKDHPNSPTAATQRQPLHLLQRHLQIEISKP